MNKQELKKYKKITIGFSDSQKSEFLVEDFTQDELVEIVTQFCNGTLMIIRNFYANPRNINYFIVDDFEESVEDL
ncbi:hypothetical protein [Streptococcus parasanguinis]|uniref:hypothetical protein n=1 Tax=Streptococcus parasanguinis TaxID=1318 RepID=UPI0020C931D4|nr:hypothetical protein [Streptococcus parasanguinis]MCP8990055.1 hypothetical protein [Streptococcus parasanguinis]MCP8991751.1 hypothetical protein [Streptococcus parasanguinis]MCP9002840.1 hypothetical protein [Streptococcus parasanguinis]MCP9009104.1 hypothetical protein [Streptococcus parasanguinis]MCP9034786.1 hypothetical protein [Streptococcus parasanguinis]